MLGYVRHGIVFGGMFLLLHFDYLLSYRRNGEKEGEYIVKIVDRENNEVQIIVRLKADLKSALDDIAATMSVSRNLLLNEIITKAIFNFNYGKEHSVDEK